MSDEAPCIYPAFRYRNPVEMIDWLAKAFGFVLRVKYGEGERIDHAELVLGSSMIMLGHVKDDEYGAMVGEPGEDGGKSTYLAVEDIDAVYASARAAGAKILKELYSTDYGSRDFICRDPEGNVWALGTYWPKAHEKPTNS